MNRVFSPTYFLIALLLMLACHIFVPVSQVILFPWTLLGLIPLGVGIGLNVGADRAFKTHETTAKPFQTSVRLVTEGVFSFSFQVEEAMLEETFGEAYQAYQRRVCRWI